MAHKEDSADSGTSTNAPNTTKALAAKKENNPKDGQNQNVVNGVQGFLKIANHFARPIRNQVGPVHVNVTPKLNRNQVGVSLDLSINISFLIDIIPTCWTTLLEYFRKK